MSDGVESDSTSFEVTVNPVNDAPVLGVIADQNIDEDTSLLLTLSADDIDVGDVLTYSAGVTGNATVDVSGDQLTVVPDSNFNGDIQVTVLVSDGDLTDSQTFTLTVDPVNDPPTIDEVSDQELSLIHI